MITLQQVGWTGYTQYEGPWYRGQLKFPKADPSASFTDKVLSVITATEGGAFDAINMYDRMIVSVGIIQWGNAGQFSVDDLLGEVAQADATAIIPVQALATDLGYYFGQTPKGWRYTRQGVLVDSIDAQRALFLGGSSGLKGGWSDEQKEIAKRWVVALQAVWDNPMARQVQASFTAKRVKNFATPQAKAVLFSGPDVQDANPNIVATAQAAFLSFAANLPAVASKQLLSLSTPAPKWSLEWLYALLTQLTFGPKIAIYPQRYNAIQPELERLWGLDLPDGSASLASWKADMGIDPKIPSLDTPRDIQRALLRLGYDLGPAGADGVMGAKSKVAVEAFQTKAGLTADGIVGPKTLETLRTTLTG
jgi:hypothetical protein